MDKQREEFEAWWEEFSSAHDEWRFADSAALRWAAWQAAQAAQPAQMPDWIATADRMPEPQVRVLGFEPQYNIVDVDMWFGPEFQWGYTYWMPIPAAPSTKEKTE
jgi:hypothetical protein